jgi:hypothetical protein
MTTSTSPMTGNGVAIANYMHAERLAGYHFEGGGDHAQQRPRGPLRHDEVVFRPDQLLGTGAEAMGLDLSGGLTLAQFSRLCEGKHPHTGEQLVAPGHVPAYEVDDAGKTITGDDGRPVRALDPTTAKPLSRAVHTAGIGMYLAAPKSVSIAAVVAAEVNPEIHRRIIDAHQGAVTATVAWVESSALLGRRTVATPTQVGARIVTKGPRKGQLCKTQGSKTERVPVQLIIATATQHTARPTEATIARAAPPDPHLHSQDLILGVAWDPVKGDYVATDDYGLKTSAVERDARYLGELARRLEEAGVPIEYGSETPGVEEFAQSRNGRVPWKVRGITDEAIDHYSSGLKRAFDLARDYEEQTGRPATAKVLQDRMRGTRHSKDPYAKRMDTNPIYADWRTDAERSGITMATPDLIERLRDPSSHTVTRANEASRIEVFRQRLAGPKGITMGTEATFGPATVTTAIARAAEGLGFTPDELDRLELDTFSELVIARPANDPRHVLYTTQATLRAETQIAAVLATKAATVYPHPSAADVETAIAACDVPLDAEQRPVVEQFNSGAGLVILGGPAGTGKTTVLKPVIAAERAAGTVDQVLVVSTAARAALSTGAKLDADWAGPVEAIVRRIERGSLAVTDKTMVIADEFAMLDTARMKDLLDAIGPARLACMGDTEQAQSIGPGGWQADAIEALGEVSLTVVHRHADPADTDDFNKLRAGGSGADVVESLGDRGRLHVSEDHQASLDRLLGDYQGHRQGGEGRPALGAEHIRIILDGANTNVDLANRQVQRYRLAQGEITAEHFTVEDKAEGRHWTLHGGDPVRFRSGYGTGKDRIPNGATGTLASITRSGKAQVILEDASQVTLALEPSTERQVLIPAYAVHNLTEQGNQATVVLYMPGTTTDKYSAYSSLTRSTHEAHIYGDRETLGEDPEATLAAALDDARPSRSAHRVMAESAERTGDGHPERRATGRRGGYTARQAADAHVQRLARVIGADAADSVRAAGAYPALVDRLDALDRSDANTAAMLRTAATERTLEGGADPAAVLVARLSHTERIERANPYGPSLAPPLPVHPVPELTHKAPQHQRGGDHLARAKRERSDAMAQAFAITGPAARATDRARSGPVAPEHSQPQDPMAQAFAINDGRGSGQTSRAPEDRLTQTLGAETAAAVRAAPRYPTLRRKLEGLDRRGADSAAMLRHAAQERPLEGASDPAAELAVRLRHTQRIEQRTQPDRPNEIKAERERSAMEQAFDLNSWGARDAERDQGIGLGRGLGL